jgi:hypothetical protein
VSSQYAPATQLMHFVIKKGKSMGPGYLSSQALFLIIEKKLLFKMMYKIACDL